MADPTSLEALQTLHGDLLSVSQHLLKPPDAFLTLEELAAAAPGLGSLLDQRRRDQRSRDMVSAGEANMSSQIFGGDANVCDW